MVRSFIMTLVSSLLAAMAIGAPVIPPLTPHIARITRDTIVVISGSTYSFTVDTPEDGGRVSTNIGVTGLLREVGGAYVADHTGQRKDTGELHTGDRLFIETRGQASRSYYILVQKMAVGGQLSLRQDSVTAGTQKELELFYTAGQRSPDATITIHLPAGIGCTLDNTTVNVIGRGDVLLKDLAAQSIGRVGTRYSYSRVGSVVLATSPGGGNTLTFSHLDLRPANGPDLRIVIKDVKLLRPGSYSIQATYTTSQPEVLTSAGTGAETAILTATRMISDFERIAARTMSEDYSQAFFQWAPARALPRMELSLDKGRTWAPAHAVIDAKKGIATATGLTRGRLYTFRLVVPDGVYKGPSNWAYCYTGKMDVKDLGVTGDSSEDATQKIDLAISYLHDIGGGTLLFRKGIYSIHTVHLQSNVWLYVDKDATIRALKGGDAPETTWFSDRKYRSGLSPTDTGPYEDPENYLTKQDVGHHYFHNTLFFGERLDNVKIMGNGTITGNGYLGTGDRIMNNPPDSRVDKLFTFKLCTNIEIGGISRPEDLWYDSVTNQPYYIGKEGAKITYLDNMLNIDRGGHFALLAAGTDNLSVHDVYFGKASTASTRDICDFMECSDVTAINIFSRSSGDDIIKPGSDCALGFTRPARNYKVRNIIGNTNCNLFQIGSETADDITDLDVDNIYVLGANKAGFSISTNDGAHIRNVCLNCGHTGPVRFRSRMYRTTTPFFISISNRGRILGAEVGKYAFTADGEQHNELLVKNVNIGKVENISLGGVDISEVYSGASGGGGSWKPYDGSQRRATPIIAGYSLPDPGTVQGGLDFRLPDGRHTGYVTDISFNDIHFLVKGGNPRSDTSARPPELGVGQYNVSNLKVQPSYGIWGRHVKGLVVTNCSFNYERPDGRYLFFLDDVIGAKIASIKAPAVLAGDPSPVKLNRSSDITIQNIQP